MSNNKKKDCLISITLRRMVLLGILVWSNMAFTAISAKLTGRITDEDGELMPGVSILEKGTSNAVMSDENGSYSINLKTPSPVIMVSFIGYKKQEIKVGSNSLLDIVLAKNLNEMEEVVVVGFGEQRKISVVGAQSQLKMSDIKVPAANLGSALAGRLPGLVVVQRSGEPGHDDADIWIRGISTFTDQNTKPLILVDGVEREFTNIDPEDIESFSVLKDASATAVYGVRGANGVIIIKTKPGKAGKPSFTFDYYKSMTRLTKSVDMADAYQYMDAANDAWGNNNSGAKLYTDEFVNATKKANGLMTNDNPRMFNKYLYPAVNWMDEVFNEWGQNQRANMNVRGGSQNASYYVSLSYVNEQGLTKTSQLENYNADMLFTRYNFMTNLNIKATDKTSIDIGVQGYVAEGNYPSVSTSDVFAQAMLVSPVAFPVLYPDGSIPGINGNGDSRNPYADISMRGYKTEYKNKVYSNLRVTQDLDYWNWSKGLKVFAMYAFDTYNTHNTSNTKRGDTFYPTGAKKDVTTGLWVDDAALYDANNQLILTKTYTGASTLSYGKSVGGNRTNYLEGGMSYDRLFGKTHRVGALMLYNQRIYQSSDQTTLIAALPNKYRGLAGRATYSFKDKYFGEMNLGYNGSESFSPDKRYGFFPAFGIGWAPSNEAFWEPIRNVFSFWKIRYTDGLVGNDVVGGRRFAYITEVNSGQSGYTFGSGRTGISGVAITDYGVDITWSTSRKKDLGMDMKFFNDQLSIVTDLFFEHRTDVFLRRAAIPGFVGLNSMPYGNLGVIDNKGIEASFEYNKTFNKNVMLIMRGNFTWNRDKIIENDEPVTVHPWMNRRGSNVNSTWGYTAEGLFTSEEDIQDHARQFGETKAGDISRVGDVKYKDLDNNGVIDSYDISRIGHGDVPSVVYGFGADFIWGNFSIAALFQGTSGADRMLNGTSIKPFSGDGGLGNLYSNIGDRADNYIVTDEQGKETLTNQGVYYPRLAWGGGASENVNNFKTSTWWMKDVSFVRLKQMSISYRFPKQWMENLNLQGGSIYMRGNNLLTFSPFKLWDPELNTSNGTSYPNVSAYSLGLSFNF